MWRPFNGARLLLVSAFTVSGSQASGVWENVLGFVSGSGVHAPQHEFAVSRGDGTYARLCVSNSRFSRRIEDWATLRNA